jgi:hypothetical protein
VHGYPGTKKFRNREHTLRRVLSILSRNVARPAGAHLPGVVDDALGTFVGYLALDAWIANQDRHHDNWGVVVRPSGARHLAPTFDHSSSLGRNETDVNRARRLAPARGGGAMVEYVAKGRSAFYSTSKARKPISTIDAFREAAGRRSLAAREWLRNLESVDENEEWAILARIPTSHISEVAIEFARRMLTLNRERRLSIGDGKR